MFKSKVELLKEEIEKSRQHINDLRKELKKICKHKNVEYRSYCTDDWAIPNEYEDVYECQDCGLIACASSPSYNDKFKTSVSANFKILYMIYWSKINPSRYRVDNFDKVYESE